MNLAIPAVKSRRLSHASSCGDQLVVGPICALLAPAGDYPKGDRLAKPVPLEVDGKPLVREGSYLAQFLFPFVGDLDGDSRQALLLGTQQDGRLLVYRNVGSKTS